LVFACQSGGALDYRATVRRYFKPMLAEAGLRPIRPYDLRHTCATLLLKADVHPKVVADRLGHAGIAMTLDTYSHVMPHLQHAAAVALERTLFAKAGVLA
jgi:integrase